MYLMVGKAKRTFIRKQVCLGLARGISRAFTLIELLVVIAVISVLMAILIPVLQRVREAGQRVVCMSNLRQLTMAWSQYADDHDGDLVAGRANIRTITGRDRRVLRTGWVMASDFTEGTLWPYLNDPDVHRCPRAEAKFNVTYSIVASANGYFEEGTYAGVKGKRVGKTVLGLKNMRDIISPSAAHRAVFMHLGQEANCENFAVHYLYAKWDWFGTPRGFHDGGSTMSMADGHVEYWKWRGKETLKIIAEREATKFTGFHDYTPQTEDSLYDLQRVQRATWGRIGYSN